MDKYKNRIVILRDAQRLNMKRVIAVVHDRSCGRFRQPTTECDCEPDIHELPEQLPPQVLAEVVNEQGWQVLHTKRHAGQRGYPPPQTNLNCKCYPNMMRAHFCMTGHMTECHYPMSCSEAECSHLERYE